MNMLVKLHDLRHSRPTGLITTAGRHGLLLTSLIVLLTGTALPSRGASLDGHTQISTAVHDFIAGQFPDYAPPYTPGNDPAADAASGNAAAISSRRVEISVTRLDPRLAIAVCAIPLQVSLNQNQAPLGKLTVRVDCQDAAPWSRYVAATVQVYQNVVVSARPLARGHVVTAADLQVSEIDVSTVRGSWLEDTGLALGKEVRRAVPAGAPITAEALVEQELIARGETIVLTAQKGAVLIRQQGVALQAGESGKQISVRNSNSERVVQAVVTGPGEAQVTF